MIARWDCVGFRVARKACWKQFISLLILAGAVGARPGTQAGAASLPPGRPAAMPGLISGSIGLAGSAGPTLIGVQGSDSTTGPATNEGHPPSFTVAEGTAVPIDIQRVDLSYEFDCDRRQARATATMRFRALEPGKPYFDLVPAATALKLDSKSLSVATLATRADSDAATTVRVLLHDIEDRDPHTLEVSYVLAKDDVTFISGAARFVTHMYDLAVGGRQFFEQFGPANFEFDQIEYHAEIAVTGTKTEHELFANGVIRPTGTNRWSIDFPNYFTSSSPYFHVTEKGRYISRTTTDGTAKKIPVTVYARTAQQAESGRTSVVATLEENEKTYGPFCHAKCVVFVTDDGGGMEYCGATTTSLTALAHEITHSWFARGVMPAEGNAGWIDEAVASWRDNRYPRAESDPTGVPVNLGGFSPFSRHTPRTAYVQGARLLSQLDHKFANSGGLRPMLRRLFTSRQRTTLTVRAFQEFLQNESRMDMSSIFNRYVYNSNVSVVQADAAKIVDEDDEWSHPHPFTKEERARFR